MATKEHSWIANPDYTLSRAPLSDLEELMDVMYGSFSVAHVRELYMGCQTREDLPKIIAYYRENCSKDPADIWLKVTENSTGNIVAASNWKLYLAAASALPRGTDEPPPWLSEEKQAAARANLYPMNEMRIKMNQDPFLHLHICFTAPEHRRRGIGSMMMQWGCDLADMLSLPAWIESSIEGDFLYKQHGFYDFQDIVRNGARVAVYQRRDARTVLPSRKIVPSS